MGSCCVRLGAHLGTLWQPRRVEEGAVGERFKGEGAYVYLNPFLTVVLQKSAKYCEATILQLKKVKKLSSYSSKITPKPPSTCDTIKNFNILSLLLVFSFLWHQPMLSILFIWCRFSFEASYEYIYFFSFSLYVYIYIYIYVLFIFIYVHIGIHRFDDKI